MVRWTAAAPAAEVLAPAAHTPPPPADTPPAPEPPLTVVEPRLGVSFADAQELWRYRELLYYLVLREVKLRYKQTILGVGWSLFQPTPRMVCWYRSFTSRSTR